MADENNTGSGSNTNTSNNASEQNGSQDSSQSQSPPQQGVMAHLTANKIETTLWLTRLATIVCSICFLLPIFGGNPYSFYQRALISTAATSALRMHQRLPNVQFNMEFLKRLFVEDSSHYLLYCIIFINSYPMTMTLIPIFLFALLHASSFTKTVLNLMGPNSLMIVRNLIAKLEVQQVNILRFIASTEILLMPAIVILIFTGKSSFLLPIIYYRFLSLRYSSRRNPYSRTLFAEFRIAIEYLSQKPQCPVFARNMLMKGVAFVCRMAPQPAAAQ